MVVIVIMVMVRVKGARTRAGAAAPTAASPNDPVFKVLQPNIIRPLVALDSAHDIQFMATMR